MFTNLGLVEHVKMALKEKWGYMNGTIGQVLTEDILQQKIRQYPNENKQHEDFLRKNYLGRRTADCICLIKSYLWWNGGNIKYSADIDHNVTDTHSIARVKGPIISMPKTPGICVTYPGHVGVYIGNNKVIEARGVKYGVVETELTERPWNRWFEYPYVLYVDSSTNELEKGKKGEDVRLLQRVLNVVGLALEEDGSFGRLTENALKSFQTSSGLDANGRVDSLTATTLIKRLLDATDSFQKDIKRLNAQVGKIKLAYVDLGEALK